MGVDWLFWSVACRTTPTPRIQNYLSVVVGNGQGERVLSVVCGPLEAFDGFLRLVLFVVFRVVFFAAVLAAVAAFLDLEVVVAAFFFVADFAAAVLLAVFSVTVFFVVVFWLASSVLGVAVLLVVAMRVLFLMAPERQVERIGG